jgi:hypothetical protein
MALARCGSKIAGAPRAEIHRRGPVSDVAGVAGQAPEVLTAGLSPRQRLLSALALTLFIAGSAAAIAINGLFLSRDVVFLWVMTGLLVVSLADVGGFLRAAITDWLPFFGALFLYDVLRGLAGDSLFTPHVTPQIDADRLLFGGEVPTVWLQERLFDPSAIQWYDLAAWAVYLTHFFAVFLVAAHLWRRVSTRPRFRRFRNLTLTLTAMAFVTYVLFPAVPPWLASDGGDLEQTRRVVGAVWSSLGVSPAAAIWEKGSTFANEVAAIPSLHTAYPVLIMLFFWPTSGRGVRALCLAYALAMSVTLVYTAEHYVADVILGWIYAAAAIVIYDRAAAAIAARRAARPPPVPGPDRPPGRLAVLISRLRAAATPRG